MLQMLGRIGGRKPDPIRQRLYAPLVLGQMFQDLQSVRGPQRAGDGGEFREQSLFGAD
jgi:hypothetical protein